jgi:hypothetical protein
MSGTSTSRLGQFVETAVGGERVRAFLPPPLPPSPPLDLQGLFTLYDTARGAVGRLDGVTAILPSTPLFLFMYVRKEALLSSQIEGTQSSLSDLLLFENDEIPRVALDDVAEVSNYVAAMEHGLKRLREGFPLSLRLIREMLQSCSNRVAAPASSPVSSAERRTGLVARVQAMRCSSRRLRTGSMSASTRSRSFFTLTTRTCRRRSRRGSRMSNSRPSTRSSMATDGLDDS